MKNALFLFKLSHSIPYVNSRAEISARAEISPCKQPLTDTYSTLKAVSLLKLEKCIGDGYVGELQVQVLCLSPVLYSVVSFRPVPLPTFAGYFEITQIYRFL